MPTDLKTIAQVDFPEIISNNETACGFIDASGEFFESVGTISDFADEKTLEAFGISSDFQFSVFCGVEFAAAKSRAKLNVGGTDYRILKVTTLASQAGYQFFLGDVK